jgi:hypothetical protein
MSKLSIFRDNALALFKRSKGRGPADRFAHFLAMIFQLVSATIPLPPPTLMPYRETTNGQGQATYGDAQRVSS